MLKKIVLSFFFIFSLINHSYASIEEKIINNLLKTDNLTFNFKQTIGKKTEEGNCTIEYPKKIKEENYIVTGASVAAPLVKNLISKMIEILGIPTPNSIEILKADISTEYIKKNNATF